MKTQFVILMITVILMQMLVQTEGGILGKLWEGFKSIVGKRGLNDRDQLDDLFDSDLSDADIKLLKEMFK
uniref:Pantinin-1 n=1 Tax=Pandinus imperator TaxID=55084 RepID=NDB4J_PANIM|nr:RecName: Full=Pantinin-1; AltName: Full=Non-disulfide-bridged peptide 4.20; Short=NDBP-4.20; AltName: Full=Non-disulfide-bridged peptide 5.21; Short=NDBP-5.21; Flags: Precursor [Pandinus imperator]AGK88380.1 pantinin 1 [Pandinus imperator]